MKSLYSSFSALKVAVIVGVILLLLIAYNRHDAKQDYIKSENIEVNKRIIERSIANEQNKNSVIESSDNDLRNSLLREGEGSLPTGLETPNLFQRGDLSDGSTGLRVDKPQQQKQRDFLSPVCKDGEIEVLYDFTVECEVVSD